MRGQTTRDPSAAGSPSWRLILRRAAPVALPFALVVIILGPHLIGVRSLAPTDQLFNWEPWRTEQPANLTPTHGAPFSDNYDAVFPPREEFATRVRNGDWPLWSQLSGGGSDLAINIGAAAGAPSAAISVATPGWYTPGLLKALELIGAWSFVFLFLRRVGALRWPAAFAGVVFALSGFQVVWVNWPHTRVAMFAAGVLWAFDRVIERVSPDRVAVAALIMGAMVLEGFPAVAAVGIGAAAIVLIVRLIQQSKGLKDGAVRVAGAGAAGLLGVGLTAAITVPFAMRLSSTGLERAVQSKLAIARGLGTVLSPNALGPAESFSGPQNYIEIVGYLGCAAVLCSVVGAAVVLVRGRLQQRDVLLLITAIAGSAMLLYSYGVEPLYGIFRSLPVLSTSSATRVKASALLLLALSSGLGLDVVIRSTLSARERVAATLAAFGTTAVIAVYLAGFAQSAPQATSTFIRGEVLRAVAIAIVTAGALLVLVFVARNPGPRLAALGVIILLASVDGSIWAISYWPRSQPSEFYPVTKSHAFLQRNVGSNRFGALGRAAWPGTSSFYGIRTVHGHLFYQPSWKELLVASGASADSQTFVSFPDPATASSPALDRLGVTYWGDSVGQARCRPLDGSEQVGESSTSSDGNRVGLRVVGPGVRGLTVTPEGSLPAGTVLALTATDASGKKFVATRKFISASPPGAPLPVAVPGVQQLQGPINLELTSSSELGPLAATTTPCFAPDDGLNLVHASGMWIYERQNALPRVRWAGTAKVVSDSNDRLAQLTSGSVPAETVVLSAPTSAKSSGAAGEVTNLSGDGDVVTADVSAEGDGFLVLADAFQTGWTATVDGRPADLVDADHAGVAVAVPAGDHRIVVTYRPKGLRLGFIISALSALVVLALFCWSTLSLRTRRRTAESGNAAAELDSPVDNNVAELDSPADIPSAPEGDAATSQ